ncbi:uncharacterized protein LOC143854681 [Tasmannia lanceolata]|uniref:uncharacterized protein LOC143854681 n=1 Tax=Tasmannia lanceolata TaxID=3420 RepID=UPI0040645DE3
MTLEDFFTLTEMKDGIATLARVEELVAVMRKEKDYVIKNVGDAARQWSSVAGIIAATENKDCLTHFIRLDGLWFVNQWLQKAQKCSDDTDDSFVEESINALLGTLEKLPVDYEQSNAAGIRATVKHLLAHKSLKVQERARTLYDDWNQGRDKDPDYQDVEKGGACRGEDPKSPDVKVTLEGGHDVSPSQESSSVSQLEFKDVKYATPIQDVGLATSNQANVNGIVGDGNSLCSSLVSNTSQESLSFTEEASQCPGGEGMTSTGTHGPLIPSERNVDNRSSGVSELKDADNETKEIQTEMNINEKCSVSSSGLKDNVPLSHYPVNSQKSVMEPDVSCDIAAKESESCPNRTISSGLSSESSVLNPQLKSGEVDCGMPKYSSDALELKPDVQTGDHYTKVSQDLSNNGCIHGKPLEVDSRELDESDRPEMEVDYRVDDALEVARQVAKEVEREVVDYREPICSSSSDKNSEGEIMQPSSPNSVEDKQCESMIEHPNDEELPTEQDLPDGGFSKVKRIRISNSIDIEPEDGIQDLGSPELTTVARESGGTIEKSICEFDLNENIYPEEIECPIPSLNQPITLSTPIPVIASAKGAPGLPSTPLHFEGELGWRGSARTSAFRPASPRRTPNGEKSDLAEASSHSSKRRQNFLKFDLNVADGDNEAAIDLVSTKQVPVSCALLSGDSSLEVSSRRAERLKLDLNHCLGDNEDATCPFPLLDQTVDRQFHHLQNGNRSPSPASSSSSRYPSMREIDLNNNPSLFDTPSSHYQWSNLNKSSSQDKSAYESFKLDDPIVSIMGLKMDVNRKELVDQTRSFLANGQSIDSAMSANLVSYAPGPPTGYGYNGLTMGPNMSLPLQFFGPGSAPYMVDSRGAPVIPLITPSFSRPPFLMSVTGSPSGLNGVSRSGIDLNSGMASMEGESREMGSLRQLFVEGQSGLMEETLKRKRKEPERGWELNMVGYKQETPWH